MKTPRLGVRAAVVLAGAALLAACGTATAPTTTPQVSTSTPQASTATDSTAPSPSGLGADGCITTFDPAVDYYPDKEKLEHARNFTLTYHSSYAVVTVKQPVVGGKPERYVLKRCGAPAPALSGDLAGAQVVTTPVKSLFSASTTHIPSLEALGKLDILTGVGSKAYISSRAALARVAQSGVTEFAGGGTADAEKIIAAKPDVLVTAGYDDPGFATVRDAGVPVLADAEFLEANPLGRAEWVKFFGALTGTEQRANDTFAKIADNYRSAVAVALDATPTKVVLSQPYQGSWAMPTGGSFAGRLVIDAKGSWPWMTNTSAGSANTDLETVFNRSGKSPVWVASSNWKTKKDAYADEPRLAEFEAFKTGKVWAPSLQVNKAGGNNYFELGVLRPDLTVKDLIAILHPDLMPGHTFTFFRQLT